MSSSPLIPARFLFRYSIPCLRHDPLWTDTGARLTEEHRLLNLAELENERPYAEVRAAWSDQGLAFSVKVEGKRQQPWCRDSRPEESDGLRIWLDTRNTQNIHRASRFCHQFLFLPTGSGRALDEPVAEQLLINRAKEHAKPVRPGVLKVRREKRVDGYIMDCLIPAAALTGWDPVENPRLGFTYAVYDRELGEQTFNCPMEFAYRDDPSLWATLELMK